MSDAVAEEDQHFARVAVVHPPMVRVGQGEVLALLSCGGVASEWVGAARLVGAPAPKHCRSTGKRSYV